MLCLSIGLVLVMMVLVGLALHLVLPDIPVALCFAVGAALGPTDAAAVVALARSTKFPKRIDGVLAAEAIYNDAPPSRSSWPSWWHSGSYGALPSQSFPEGAGETTARTWDLPVLPAS